MAHRRCIGTTVTNVIGGYRRLLGQGIVRYGALISNYHWQLEGLSLFHCFYLHVWELALVAFTPAGSGALGYVCMGVDVMGIWHGALCM